MSDRHPAGLADIQAIGSLLPYWRRAFNTHSNAGLASLRAACKDGRSLANMVPEKACFKVNAHPQTSEVQARLLAQLECVHELQVEPPAKSAFRAALLAPVSSLEPFIHRVRPSTLNAIRVLRFVKFQLSDAILEVITCMPCLEVLVLKDCGIWSLDFYHLSRCLQLKEITLERFQKNHKCTRSAIESLAAIKSLRALHLKGPSPNWGFNSVALSALVQLTKLTIDGRTHDAYQLSSLCNLQNLEALMDPRDGDWAPALQCMTALTSLRVHPLSDKILDIISDAGLQLVAISAHHVAIQMPDGVSSGRTIPVSLQRVHLQSMGASRAAEFADALLASCPMLASMHIRRLLVDVSYAANGSTRIEQLPAVGMLKQRGVAMSCDAVYLKKEDAVSSCAEVLPGHLPLPCTELQFTRFDHSISSELLHALAARFSGVSKIVFDRCHMADWDVQAMVAVLTLMRVRILTVNCQYRQTVDELAVLDRLRAEASLHGLTVVVIDGRQM